VSLLAVEGIDVFYGDVQAVRGVSFSVEPGEVVTLIGANGAGKSTTLKTVAGLLAPRRGRIVFDGADVAGSPAHALAARGLVLVPEGRQLWPGMSVLENLRMGAYPRAARAKGDATLEEVFAMFPVLKRRIHQKAGTLSGGEQQMCAIGRGLMAQPRLLLLDEPALGLSPLLVREVFATLREIRARGVTVLVVEQNVKHALALADRAYVMETGAITLSGRADDLRNDNGVRDRYLGYASV
jgi:branched-chain amino acid transport system ATP-binding protein